MNCYLVLSIVVYASLIVNTDSLQSSWIETAYVSETDSQENKEIVKLILNSLLNTNKSLAAIKHIFNKVPDITVCAAVSYQVTFTEQDNCTASDVQCESGYNSTQIWTQFDPQPYSGRLLYYILTTWKTVPGFDWDEACVSLNYSIEVDLPLIPHISSGNLDLIFSYVTTLVSCIATIITKNGWLLLIHYKYELITKLFKTHMIMVSTTKRLLLLFFKCVLLKVIRYV